MPTEHDKAFVKAAVEAGLVRQPLAEACLALIRDLKKKGRPKTVAEVMAAKRFLTSDEAREVLAKIGRKIARCPSCQTKTYLTLSDRTGGACIKCAKPLRAAAPELEIEADPLVGRQIAHLKLLEKLGSGGMGTVYKAKNVNLGRPAAVKVLAEHVKRKGSKEVRRFLREARAAAGLDHPNVVRVHYVGSEKGRHFIEMEYVQGESLGDMIRREGALPADKVIPIIRQAADALAVAHEQGLIHRDVKPDNILVTPEGKAKVTDFGLVKMDDESINLTAVGLTVGTPNYIPPEIFAGQDPDARVDVYGLGATFYEALTGRVLYEANSPLALIAKQRTETPPHPSDANPAVPRPLGDLIERMIHKDRNQRFATMTECIAALASIQGAPQPLLIEVRSDGTCVEHPLNRPELGIGRSSSCDIPLPDGRASKNHARVVFRENALHVEDQNSRNGTKVNDERVQSKPLVPGDIIQIGQTSLVYLLAPAPGKAAEPPISSEAGAWRLTFAAGPRAGETLGMSDRPLVLGRHAAASCRLEDPELAPLHVQLRPAETDVRFQVIPPVAAVQFKGQAVERGTASHGDVLHVGASELRVEATGQPATRAPQIKVDSWANGRLAAPAAAPAHAPQTAALPDSFEIDAPATEPVQPVAAPPPTDPAASVPSADQRELMSAIAAESARVDSEFGVSGVFVGNDDDEEGGLTLTCTQGKVKGRSFPLTSKPLILGRDATCGIALNQPGVSREHAQFQASGPKVTVKDLNSANGVLVNGKRIKGEQQLKAGDEIRVAAATFLLHL